MESRGAVSMPPIIGAAIRLITSEPVPWPRRIGSQAGEDHRDGHRLGPHAKDGAVAHGAFDLGVGGVVAPRRQGVLEIDQHHHAELGRQAGQGDEADRRWRPTVGSPEDRASTRPPVSAKGRVSMIRAASSNRRKIR